LLNFEREIYFCHRELKKKIREGEGCGWAELRPNLGLDSADVNKGERKRKNKG